MEGHRRSCICYMLHATCHVAHVIHVCACVCTCVCTSVCVCILKHVCFVAASHRSGRSARRAGLQMARFVNLAHLARHTLFSLLSTQDCGWLLASATSSDRLSCDSHGALCTSQHTLWCCVPLLPWSVTSREQIVVEHIVADPVPQILEEIVVAGDVVCDLRTGVR